MRVLEPRAPRSAALSQGGGQRKEGGGKRRKKNSRFLSNAPSHTPHTPLSPFTLESAPRKTSRTTQQNALSRAAAAPARRTAVVAKAAERPASAPSAAAVAAAAALSLAVSLGGVQAASADISGLTPCSESKAYARRLKNEVKGLNKRLKQYEADSAPALALKATIERTEQRFANYGKAGLLCGTDGLPHLISDPGLALKFGHAGEVFVSRLFLFLLS
jgi:hypothetical protein